jgi:hypothetical protein
MPAHDEDHGTRQERRERRRQKRRSAMPKHAANLAQVYRSAVLRRLQQTESKKAGG